MKILVFTEGTIIMHAGAVCHSREEIVRQVQDRQESVYDFGSCVPVGGAAIRLENWKRQGAEIVYLTSRTTLDEVQDIRNVLSKYDFPEGELLFRLAGEEYKDVAERVMPDVLIEDDCESIGGKVEMTYPHMRPDLKEKVKSIVVREFGGIDDLPGDISDLAQYR